MMVSEERSVKAVMLSLLEVMAQVAAGLESEQELASMVSSVGMVRSR